MCQNFLKIHPAFLPGGICRIKTQYIFIQYILKYIEFSAPVRNTEISS